jgi:hypothetical protein
MVRFPLRLPVSDPSSPPRPAFRLLLLFTLWAALLALSAWNRQLPGARPLPDRILLDGHWWPRLDAPPLPAIAALPPSLRVIGAADYGVAGRERVALRWIEHLSSGRSVDIPVTQLGAALLGSGAATVCRVYADDGIGLLGVAQRSEQVEALLRRKDPRGWRQVQWLLGLRAMRRNRCLLVVRGPALAAAAPSVSPQPGMADQGLAAGRTPPEGLEDLRR